MSNSKIKIQSCTLMALTAGLMLSLGSQAVFAQGCVTSPPQPAECYHSISVGVGEFSWNWPPPGALLICPDGIPLGFAWYWVRNNQCPAKPKCLSCGDAGAPINLASGDTYISQTDIRLPGLGGGLTLSRTWNSILFDGFAQLGMFGFRWTSNFEESVYVGGDGLIEYQRSDGGIWQFANNGGDSQGPLYVPVSPANEPVTLQRKQTNWTVKFQNGEAGWPSIRAKALSRA